MTQTRCTLASFFLVLATACGGSKVDPVAANAGAGCETATASLLEENETMLPGRACNNCHKAGGQADESDVRWTVAGTVFGSMTAMCNTGGVSGAKVDILTMDGTVQFSLTTNAVGNFYTTQAVKLPLRAKVTKNGKTQEMFGMPTTGNCASCHQVPGSQGTSGRIFIN